MFYNNGVKIKKFIMLWNLDHNRYNIIGRPHVNIVTIINMKIRK